MQTCLFGGEGDFSVLQHEAGNADAAVPAGLVEDRAAVSQAEEGLEVPYVFSDVDYLVSVIVPDLSLDTGAVGAGMHSVDSDHGSGILYFFREDRHLNETTSIEPSWTRLTARECLWNADSGTSLVWGSSVTVLYQPTVFQCR